MFDYEQQLPIAYDCFSFPPDKVTYAKALVAICDIVRNIILDHNISAVFIEDIQLRKNVDSFKKLAQLQGSLVSMFERNEYLYDFVPPSKWQSYCYARGRTVKEIKAKLIEGDRTEKNKSKLLSIEFVRERFGIETLNDNLADAICIGFWAVNNTAIKIK